MYLAHVINRELAEIRAAGLPTNGEELNRWYAAVPDNQNAALVLMQAFALLKTINTYSDKRAEEAWKLKDRFPRRADQLTAEQVELIRWHVEVNLPALTKTHDAIKLPGSRYPIDCKRLFSMDLSHLANLVNLAYLNQCKAALAILDGRKEAAFEDIEAILALARTLDNEPCLISQLVRYRIIRTAFATLELRANSGSMNSAEITSLNEAFTHTRTTNMTARALIGERAMTIPYFRMSRAEASRLSPVKDDADSKKISPWPYNGPAVLRLVGYYELDYGSYLIGMSKGIALLSNSAPDNLRAGGYFTREGEESTKRGRSISGRNFLVYSGSALRENEGIAHKRLALTALAVESFRNEAARLPENLEELAPKYLEEVLEDPFAGSELKYHRTEKGYVVYSVGPDRHDDGGLEKGDKKQSDDKKSYDITFTVER